MTYQWAPLETSRFDSRLFLIAGYLSKRIDGKYIVDLDCGPARLIKFLSKTYASYYGNDIIDIKSRDPAVLFEKITDEDAARNLENKKVDILICLGIGAGWLGNPSGLESTTFKDSVLKIVKDHTPEIVILESPQEYSMKYGNLDDLKKALPQYTTAYSFEVETLVEQDKWTKRIVHFLELKKWEEC